MFKQDFPLFISHLDLVYLDNAASVQKPQAVLDTVDQFITHDYANVHRGLYDLSERAEETFRQARKTIATWHGCRDDEVVFTPGTTLGIAMLTSSLMRSGWISEGEVMVLSSGEHHANIVPRQILAEQTGAIIAWIDTDEAGEIQYDHLQQIIDQGSVRLVAVQACSNVTGTVQNLARVRTIIGNDTVLVVDASQSAPHYQVDRETVRPDFLFWTGHKLGAHTGCGVMISRKHHLQALTPGRGGGGAIDRVTTSGHTYQGSPDKFEPGTPNLVGAVSMGAGLDYLNSIGGYETIQSHEAPLVEYCLQQSIELEKNYDIKLLGSRDATKRIGVFGYTSESLNLHQIGQRLADQNICVRVGGQCAHPLHAQIDTPGSLRMSLWITNTMQDCEKFFSVIRELFKAMN